VEGGVGVITTSAVARRAGHVLERNMLAYRRMWPIFASGFLEPVLYLFSIGIGVGHLVGRLPGPGGRLVPYDAYVAPGLMAAAAMNGSVLDTTMNFFVRYKYTGTYKTMLATPIRPIDIAYGEVGWGLLRGSAYSCAFLVAMLALGLVHSGWAVLALPAAILIGFAFAGAGLAATTWMRSFIDFDYVNLAVVPMFLFSATFFPLSRYPSGVQWLVRITPLYQGVALIRTCTLATPGPAAIGHAAYLLAMGLAGLRVAGGRLNQLMEP
jgi:lipooligosaccharide transport system permease protein